MPIIAVLPFANQTGDDSQDYFADGVTEEVINALGRFNTLARDRPQCRAAL